jgi:hypothetical protein
MTTSPRREGRGPLELVDGTVEVALTAVPIDLDHGPFVGSEPSGDWAGWSEETRSRIMTVSSRTLQGARR